MKYLGITLMGAIVLAGCGSVRYPATYVLNLPQLPVARPVSFQGVLSPVAVREFTCREYLCEGRIVYRSSPEEIGFYEYHRWAMDPREAITQYLVEALQAQSLFKSVAVRERGTEAAYSLSGNIERLEEVDEGRGVRVVCTISARLLETRTRAVLWSHTASETVPVEKRDVRGIVSSLSAVAQRAVDRLLQSMTEELGSTAAVTPTESPRPTARSVAYSSEAESIQ